MPKFFSWKVWAAGAVAALLPMAAFAQSLFGPIDAGDVSVSQFLSKLFGELVGGDGNDPLVALLATFNAGVLVIGGILVFYTLVAGTLSTAHDGEMLGKRWSSLWVPIRTTLGAAAIMPSLAGGYCVIQAIVIWLALQGVGMANTMWNAFLDQGAQQMIEGAFYSPPGNSRQIRETFHDMFMSSACTAAFKKSQEDMGVLGSIGARVIPAEISPVTIGNVSGFNYGPAGAMCGKVYMQTGSPASVERPDGPASSSALVDAQAIADALVPVHMANMNAAKTTMEQLANRLVQGQLTAEEYDQALNSLVNNYTSELRSTAKATHDAQKEALSAQLISGMKVDGWALAGIYYMAVVRAQDEITRAVSQTPASASGELWGTGDAVTDVISAGPAGLLKAGVSAAMNSFINSGERKALLDSARSMIRASNSGTLSQIESIADDATGNSWIMKVVSWFMNDDMSFLGNSEFAQQNQNPIIMAKNLGENMTTGAWSALGIGGGALALSGLGAGVAGAWATVFSQPLFALFAVFVVPGAMLSTYVPMIPYILWVGVIIGWVILVVEAVIAAPIWAVAHMAPDGDGVVGRGGQGYMLVLSLTLRPPLMIMGLACSIALMQPVGYFINSTFLGAFAVGVNPSPLGLTQAIAGCVIYAIVMISVIHRVFSLIHVVPDRILRWIGGGGNELGEQATSVEGMSASKIGGAMMATNQIGSLTQGTMQGIRDLKKRGADDANAASIRSEEQRSRMAQVEANENDQAYRAGNDAQAASSRAEHSPYDTSARSQAAMSNEMARDARLGEAETKLDHYMSQSGEKSLAGGLAGLRAQPMSARQQLAQDLEQSSPQAAAAVHFANGLDQSRADMASNPQSNSMQQFLGGTVEGVRQNGAGARSWQVAAAKAASYEGERQKWSRPPADGGGDNDAPPPPPPRQDD